MIPPVKSRRGMTLAELIVAMAMVVILIVMVVSFVTIMTGHTRTSSENLAFEQDFAAVKAGVEAWMSATAGKELSAVGGTNDKIDATALKAEDKTLRFEHGMLTGGNAPIRAESVGTVTFLLQEKSGQYLLFCTVTRADGKDSYTFCVDPRVGEPGGTP